MRRHEIVNGSMTVDFDLDKIQSKLRQHAYEQVGSGSGRNVYDIGGGFVAKVARNQRGIAQNEAEYRISLSDSSGLFASIITATPDLRVTIMAKAEPLEHFCAVLRYFRVRDKRELYKIPLIYSALRRHRLVFPDLCRVQNWGVVNGRPVIVDYGFTTPVKRKYY